MHVSNAVGTVLLAWCCLFGSAAHADPFLQLSTSQTFVAVAAGTAIEVALHLNNSGDSASVAGTVLFDAPAGYAFEQRSAPTCGVLEAAPNDNGVQFAVPPVAAGATLTCTIRITRAADTIDSVVLGIAAVSGSFHLISEIFVGTFVDIALSSERISYAVDTAGVAHGVFRLTAKNVGSVAVEAFDAATCSYEASIDSAIAGGCAATTSLCARGFIPFAAQGARLPALAPGEETSCLLQLSAPATTPAAPTLTLDEEPEWNVFLIDASTGGHVFDANPANNATILPLVPAGGGAPGVAVPALSRGWQILLTGLLALATTVLWRRRRDVV